MTSIGASVALPMIFWGAFMPLVIHRSGIGIVLSVEAMREPQSMLRNRRPITTGKNIEGRSREIIRR